MTADLAIVADAKHVNPARCRFVFGGCRCRIGFSENEGSLVILTRATRGVLSPDELALPTICHIALLSSTGQLTARL
jgi:hypothetical protein